MFNLQNTECIFVIILTFLISMKIFIKNNKTIIIIFTGQKIRIYDKILTLVTFKVYQ